MPWLPHYSPVSLDEVIESKSYSSTHMNGNMTFRIFIRAVAETKLANHTRLFLHMNEFQNKIPRCSFGLGNECQSRFAVPFSGHPTSLACVSPLPWKESPTPTLLLLLIHPRLFLLHRHSLTLLIAKQSEFTSLPLSTFMNQTKVPIHALAGTGLGFLLDMLESRWNNNIPWNTFLNVSSRAFPSSDASSPPCPYPQRDSPWFPKIVGKDQKARIRPILRACTVVLSIKTHYLSPRSLDSRVLAFSLKGWAN